MSTIPTPPGWRLTTIGGTALPERDAVVGGPFGSSLTSADYRPEGVPVIRGSNLAGVGCRFIDDDFVYVSPEKADELRRNVAQAGDLIFTQRGTMGQVAIIPTHPRFPLYIVSQSQMRVRIDERTALPRFVYWAYRNPFSVRTLEAATLATGVPHINLGILRDFPIALPPLAEQRRIAAILDEADAIRRKRREALGLLDDLLRSTFLQMFGDPLSNPKGWPVTTLGTTFAASPRNGTTKPAHEGGESPVVRVGELGRPFVDLNSCGRISLPEAEASKFRCVKGDILLARAIGSEDHLGKASLVQESDTPVLFDSHVMRLRFRGDRLSSTFFRQWLLTPGGRAQFMKQAGRTAVQFNVNADQISAVRIPLPPVSAQVGFEDFDASIHRLRERFERATFDAETLFSSLLHRAFSGAL